MAQHLSFVFFSFTFFFQLFQETGLSAIVLPFNVSVSKIIAEMGGFVYTG